MKIFVRVKTKAKIKKLIKIDEAHYSISINSLPEKGKANKEIVKTLAKYFSTTISKINIISGEKSKEKIIEITI
ncbi:hypothetical protein COY12_01140 [Candidatus Roizmanbacteria bacterium CG_4_10_14_0_2_um_filter_33_96]|uniref:Uncharacterized protein n=2 Tax=Candidatus Roizmaniibacteriota TaxID=1752723 RepID=A0A2M7U9E8_9BACT|nr:MAG: hypothetical protein COW97_00235 [Candidatus Roizmanbacteria bacterium CG22_combo_CG10-13_8_21_14_all_34_12]PIZ67832.1 MAG: hypothetical protein COY12_01140 [Candidatus Roizmanbacteria bacterium CG_4_10_14_0_2_um_filter_33_96]